MSETSARYELTIKEFEAIIGTKKLLPRKGKKLEVKIPSGVSNRTVVRLPNALEITNGCIGDILIEVRIAPIEETDPKYGANLDLIFQRCLHEIGGAANSDICRHVERRSRLISRGEFFRAAIWAVWVSGMSRKAAARFMSRVEKEMVNLDFANFASFERPSLVAFMEKLHGRPVPERAEKKWLAIHHIANWVSEFPNDDSFCSEVFHGKHKGSVLDETDANRLRNQRLPFIREANANYLVKTLGGEAIKNERWVGAFLQWGQIGLDELKARLRQLRIPLDLFDTVFWCYCEKFIGKVGLFDRHFSSKFGFLSH